MPIVRTLSLPSSVTSASGSIAPNIPNIAVYTGGDAWGVHFTGVFDEDPPAKPEEDPRFRIDVKVDEELANHLLHGLIAQGFDVANVTEMDPQSRPGAGVPHAWCNPAPHVLHRPDIPVVLVFVNVDDGPPAILNGQRCLELGAAIAQGMRRRSQAESQYMAQAACRTTLRDLAAVGLTSRWTTGSWSSSPMAPWRT